MPLLKGYVEVELYRGHPLELDHTLLAPWENEQHTRFAPLYGETEHTIQMWATIEKDHLDHLVELVDFGKSIVKLAERIGQLADSPDPKSVVLSGLAAQNAYQDFREFLDTFRDAKASKRRCFSVTYPNRLFDSMVVRLQAVSEEDDLPGHLLAVSPSVNMPISERPSISFLRQLDSRANFVSPSGKEWDQFRQVEYVIDFRRLEQEFGEDMYDRIPFILGFAMESITGGLGIELVLDLVIERPPPPRITRIAPMQGSPGTRVMIDGGDLLGTKEVVFGNFAALEFTHSAFQVSAVVPELPPGDPGEQDPIQIRTNGGFSEIPVGVFRILRRLVGLRSRQQEEGQVLRAGDVVEVEGVHLREITGISWVGGTGVFGERRTETGAGFPATWRVVIERNYDGLIRGERVFVAVPDGLPSVSNLVLTTLGETKVFGAFFIQSLPTITVAKQVGGRRQIEIQGKNLQPLEKVVFGEIETAVVQSTDTKIVVNVPGRITTGHIIVQTSAGLGVSSGVVTLVSIGPLD